MDDWRQRLLPLPPDEAVRQLLDQARFLWQPAFAPARGCLAGEHRLDGRRQLWVAGPGGFRRRVTGSCHSWSGLRKRLESAEASACWREPGTRDGNPLLRARWMLANGCFESASRLLESHSSSAAGALQVSCRARLGRLEAARRQLGRLEPSRLDEHALIELTETAVWLHGSLGQPRAARPWIRRALAVESDSVRRRALLAAAGSAWDRGELARMEGYLERARPDVEGEPSSWRWRHVAGLGALAQQDPAAACRHFGRALGDSRRRLGRFEAAALWNDLGLARVAAGDLAGAERALVHSVRLHERTESSSLTTLALFNLAAVRLRRGRPAGVREIFERSHRLNKESGNWRALAYDRELLARLELVCGHPERALDRVDRALDELVRRGVKCRRGALLAIAARALGWMEKPAAAAQALARAGRAAGTFFEAEEMPALYALAGDAAAARRSIGAGAIGRLWAAALGSDDLPPDAWRGLEGLEPYRAARLVVDLELVQPGLVPRSRTRSARDLLERTGNQWLTARLDRVLEGAWIAVESYLKVAPAEAPELETLFRDSGHAGAGLIWKHRGVEHEILSGAGGDERLSTAVAGGELTLTAPRIDGALRVLFALAARDWRPAVDRRTGSPEGIVGRSPALLGALARARRLAGGEIPVLILGETGTGKELCARYLHAESERRHGPLLPLNSAALAESLVLSDLFGHARGAFTGADRDRPGIFEAARGGTVLLDEIGDLPLTAQGMLLRVLQEGEVRRLGDNRVRPVDVRVIAATHRRLERRVADGRFRADLYYRLAVGTVELPPLRERGDDLDLLIRHFLDRFGGDRRLVLSPAATERLRRHLFPGNVRELANCLAVAAALAERGVVGADHLGLPDPPESPIGGYHQQVLELRRRLVREALEAAGGSQAGAARRLGMSRQALSYLVRTLGLP